MTWSPVSAAIDALVAGAKTALAGVADVIDGYGATSDGSNYLMVGIEDPFGSSGVSANGSQDWAYIGAETRKEQGLIWNAAYAWNGNGDQKQARDEASAIVNAIYDAILADPALGQASVLWFSFGTEWSMTQDQDNNGAGCMVAFTVLYEAQF